MTTILDELTASASDPKMAAFVAALGPAAPVLVRMAKEAAISAVKGLMAGDMDAWQAIIQSANEAERDELQDQKTREAIAAKVSALNMKATMEELGIKAGLAILAILAA